MPAKVIFLDIETAPSLGWAWAKYDTNIIEFQRTWYLLSFAYKQEGGEIVYRALPDYPRYKKNHEDDHDLIADLWKVLDEADIVVAHNGDSFDVKKAAARFVIHGMKPPSPFKTVDTLKVAKKYFKFESNSQSDLGPMLGLGRKAPHKGFSMWRGCMNPEYDHQSWEDMKQYNIRDIVLLEQIYLRLRPWHTGHPNLNLYVKLGPEDSCPGCQSTNVQRRGFNYAKVQVRQRFRCKDCGTWYSGKTIKQEKK